MRISSELMKGYEEGIRAIRENRTSLFEDVNHFIMGSRRFGFEKVDSDLDVCVRSYGPSGCDKDCKILLDAGGEEFLPSEDEAYGSKGTYRRIKFQGVDFVILWDGPLFGKKQAQHSRLESALLSHPFYADILMNILHLKNTGAEGKTVYRLFVNAVLGEEAI